ncbi:MAG: hypothetical protein JWS12_524 [Candidatus Saccharibacteria bacterium]|nr:hypothetical protein [Candidatus Saccharibacteria bacterium]
MPNTLTQKLAKKQSEPDSHTYEEPIFKTAAQPKLSQDVLVETRQAEQDREVIEYDSVQLVEPGVDILIELNQQALGREAAEVVSQPVDLANELSLELSQPKIMPQALLSENESVATFAEIQVPEPLVAELSEQIAALIHNPDNWLAAELPVKPLVDQTIEDVFTPGKIEEPATEFETFDSEAFLLDLQELFATSNVGLEDNQQEELRVELGEVGIDQGKDATFIDGLTEFVKTLEPQKAEPAEALLNSAIAKIDQLLEMADQAAEGVADTLESQPEYAEELMEICLQLLEYLRIEGIELNANKLLVTLVNSQYAKQHLLQANVFKISEWQELGTHEQKHDSHYARNLGTIWQSGQSRQTILGQLAITFTAAA